MYAAGRPGRRPAHHGGMGGAPSGGGDRRAARCSTGSGSTRRRPGHCPPLDGTRAAARVRPSRPRPDAGHSAGPVATRTLALFGADVLRVDAPQLPESPEAHADTGLGQAVHAARPDRRARTGAPSRSCCRRADVVVTGYRPGALDRFGLAPDRWPSRRPGLVVAQLSAWGAYGPWGERRGFDSVVQVATASRPSRDPRERPGALPAQALDHGTGYLLAAAVLRAAHRAAGRGRHARAATGSRPDRALADAGAPARAHRGHGDVRRREPGALAHGDRQSRGTAAARAAAGRLRRRACQLGPSARALGCRPARVASWLKPAAQAE